MNIQEERFWNMTPRKFFAVLDKYNKINNPTTEDKPEARPVSYADDPKLGF